LLPPWHFCAFIYIAIKGGAASMEPLLLAVIFARLLPRFQMAQSDFRDLLAILPQHDALRTLTNEAAAAAETLETQHTRIHMTRELRLENLQFRYTAEGPWVLADVSLRIKRPSSLGIIGMSGAGKTTLVDILAGLIPPTAGSIHIDGKCLKLSDLAAWRGRVAYVTQEEFLFNDTIRANLTIARPETTEREIWDALMQSHAAELVGQLPEKLETPIGDRGSRLSKGQRQRLCLARALIGKPDSSSWTKQRVPSIRLTSWISREH